MATIEHMFACVNEWAAVKADRAWHQSSQRKARTSSGSSCSEREGESHQVGEGLSRTAGRRHQNYGVVDTG
jgi:hypothetical protein